MLRGTRRAHVLRRRRGFRARCRYRTSVWPERDSRDVARALFHMVAGKQVHCMANAVRCVRGGLLLTVLTIFVIHPVATDITGKCFLRFISILIIYVISRITALNN